MFVQKPHNRVIEQESGEEENAEEAVWFVGMHKDKLNCRDVACNVSTAVVASILQFTPLSSSKWS